MQQGSGGAVSTVSLSLRYVWGGNAGGVAGLEYVDATTVVYVAGSVVVLYNTEDGTQRFISVSTQCEGVSALSLSNSKKWLAVGECGEAPGVIVYDRRSLRKRKVLSQSLISCRSWTSLAFSQDDDLLMALSGSTLLIWRWTKGKVILPARIEANCTGFFSVKCSQIEAKCFSVIAPSAIVFGSINKNDELTMKPASQLDPELGEILSQCWLFGLQQNYCLAGTSSGHLLLFKDGIQLAILDTSLAGRTITAIVAKTKGFLAGTSLGSVHLFDLIEENEAEPSKLFAARKQQLLPDTSEALAPGLIACGVSNKSTPIIALGLKPTEDAACAQTADHQHWAVSLCFDEKTDTADTQQTTKIMTPLPNSSGWHAGGTITGLDTCVRKPLAVTVGSDRTLRLWNWITSSCELCKQLSDEPLSVAIHPSGLHCIVGFSDKLRLMHILLDDLRVFREIPIKGCREVSFAHGGHWFAAVNGPLVLVYDFYGSSQIDSEQSAIELRGHTSKVRTVAWSPDDTRLVTCGQDGSLYAWDWLEAKRVAEHVQKGTMYCSAALSQDALVAVGSERIIREFEMPDLQPKRKDPSVTAQSAELPLNCCLLPKSLALQHLVFVGTAEPGRPGLARLCPRQPTAPDDYGEFSCAASLPIAKMKLTPDDSMLIVASDDGNITVFDVKRAKERRTSVSIQDDVNDGDLLNGWSLVNEWSDDVLLTRADLDDMDGLENELKTQVEETQLQGEYQLRLKEMAHAEKIKEIGERYMQELEQQKTQFELLREEKNEVQLECEERVRQTEDRHSHELQEVESEYQRKIMAEVEAYQQAVQERDIEEHRRENQRRQLVSSHENYVRELVHDLEQKLEEERQTRLHLEEERKQMECECAEIERQLEEDIDTEIQNVRHRYETKLAAEREAQLRYKGENGIMKKKFVVINKDIEEEKDQIKALLSREKELQEQLKKLEKEIAAHKLEIKKRDEVIGQKEKKIYELKKKNQELEKFKFVLDYKIKELKRQIEPRESEITAMKSQIKSMDHELEQYHKSNAQLDLMIGELRNKIDSAQSEILESRKKVALKQTQLSKFCKEIHACVQYIQEPKQLRESVDALYQSHKDLIPPNPDSHTNKVTTEHERHDSTLRKQLDILQQQFDKEAKIHSEQNLKLMANNMSLIRDINKQREHNRSLKLTVQSNELKNTSAVSSTKSRRSSSFSSHNNQFLHELNSLQDEISLLEIQCRDKGLDPGTIVDTSDKSIGTVSHLKEEVQSSS